MTTAFEFTCPSCAAPGRARADWSGRTVRCRHCKATFVLPTPGEAAADSYDLATPAAPEPAPVAASPGDGASTFTPTYRDAPLPDVPRDRPKRRRRRDRPPKEELREWAGDLRVRILFSLGACGLLLALAAFTIPGFGPVGGWMLVGTGLLLIAVGFFVGAFAAFSEDALYGMAYVFFPIYTGYYLVSRFEDLWPWFSASTIGFVLFLLGTKALELSGVF